MPSLGKKLHHFVPRFYLKAWATGGQVFCLQNGQIHLRNLKNVGAENYFYRLHELSAEEVEFIETLVINDSPDGLKEIHRSLLHAFTVPHAAKRMLEDAGKATPETLKHIEQLIIEMNENLHGAIEDSFQPLLASMLAGDLSFLDDPFKAAGFYKGLATQYSRTHHVNAARRLMSPDRFELYMKVVNPLTHIIATNVGRGLYADRNRHKILLLDNATTVPFVSADQPAINISVRPNDFTVPAKFELYYPLSPNKAMLLVEPDSQHYPGDVAISAERVHLYNLYIAAHAYRQVYSNSKEELEAIRTELSAFQSCF